MSNYDATDFSLAVSAATGAILGRAKALAPASWQPTASVLDCARMLTPLGFAAELLHRIAARERTSLAAQAESIAELLVSKNAAYGNSALDPIRVYSRAPAAEQIRVRIDDKLSRLARGARAGEDVEVDLLGYLVLLIIAEGEDA